MRTLDLFSGIGGISLALSRYSKTVAYCEKDKTCRMILENNMKDGSLEEAPVFPMVQQLGKNELHALEPELLTAGFPCQDISCAGSRLGLEGKRSGLFSEIIRILEQCPSVKHVLLENSPCIRTRGLDTVKEELERVGFVTYVYMYASASDVVGTRHKRSRWVMLASRDPHRLRCIDITKGLFENSNWIKAHHYDDEPVNRITNFNDQEANKAKICMLRSRCSALGNSVVPQFIEQMFLRLVGKIQERLDNPNPYDSGRDWGKANIYQGKVNGYSFSEISDIQKNNVDLKLELVSSDGHSIKKMKRWFTPTHSRTIWHHLKKKTSWCRGLHNLPNNVYYEKGSIPLLKGFYMVNPEFVEHLMGYPFGWTDPFQRGAFSDPTDIATCVPSPSS